ncbi:MAG: sulfatase [Chthoniobacteraceae bacterium]
MKSIITLAFLLTPLLALAGEKGSPPRKPNVLFIVADDLRCSLGCYGDSQVKSPNIDRLAARGMRFERAYCQYPVCNPSRSSFLTGWRPDTTGIFGNDAPLRAKFPDVVTMPQLFRQSGYFTASLGKILHAGLDEKGNRVFFQDAKSWDDCRNFEATKTGRQGEGRNLTGGALKWCSWLSANGTDEDQPDGQSAAEAIKLLEAHRDSPFFLAVGFHKPHDPFNAPKKYFDLYPLDQIELAKEPDDRSVDLPLALPNAKNFAAFTDAERREFRRAYFAGISFTDAQIGKLFDTLDRLKLWENTIVVVMGDHGYHLGEHGWWNKVTVFELCARTPLIVWAPGARGMGRSAPGIVEFVDIFPTLAELCGLTPPAKQEGMSFRALLDDPARTGKAAAFTQVTRGELMGRSIRTDRWRYTEWDEGRSGVELYDHADDHDPAEYHNLASDPRHAEEIAKLAAMLHAGPAALPR